MSTSSNDLQATRLFTEALEFPIEDRPRFLDQACAGNPDLRAKVEALPLAHSKAASDLGNLSADAETLAAGIAHAGFAATAPVSDPMTGSSSQAGLEELDPLAQPPDGEIRLAHYRLHEQIGRGGMGTVYRADDTLLDRQVAVKVLADELSANPELRDRFVRETRIIARMSRTRTFRRSASWEARKGVFSSPWSGSMGRAWTHSFDEDRCR